MPTLAIMNTQNPPPIAFWSHVAPFGAWLLIMFGLDQFGGPAAWKYAVRSSICLALFIGFKPWRWYGSMRPRNLLWATPVGFLVFALWVLPESDWAGQWPAFRGFYLRWAVLPLAAPALSAHPCAPESCGWFLTLVRVLGSGLVIAPIEEFFWRGFLCRWLTSRCFLRLDPRSIPASIALAASLAFGFEHQQWLAGFLAGGLYLGLYMRTRDLWAVCVAHTLTNLLLGAYVVLTGAYGFW